MLTSKQLQLLNYIESHTQKHGVTPSFDEMKDALGLRSKSGIHRLITGLEERGFIRRLANRARAIEVIRSNETPETSAAMQIGEAANTNQVPFLGRIAAGLPIQAQFENMSTDVPPSMLSQSGKHYALEVTGDSMVGVGIITGDIVVIRETSDARDGDIVVAQIEGYEATLKTYKRDGGDVVLVSENPNYPPRRIPNGHVSIQGKMVGLIRKC
ncbi:MAG: transcriptional repressor LexA [Paracoccaceae bacterium]